MKIQAAKGRKLLFLVAALALAGVFLATTPAEASRPTSPPITAALGVPRVTLETLENATARDQVEPENRFRLFPDRARDIHRHSAADGDAPHPAVLSRLGVLDVLSSTLPRPSDQNPHCAQRLSALATNPGKYLGLACPTHPLDLLQVKKTASGVFDLGIECNVWQTGGLSQKCSSPSFQGLWTDPTTGLSYARNRWYDARTASWLSEDPMGAVDSPNLYAVRLRRVGSAYVHRPDGEVHICFVWGNS
ncbi:MAG: hypothetical protein K8R59_06585 [Thermoanaerobaculales bacterium]|nr:hypothetical protein [Thermoanaerobaculales bacterium]